MKEKVQKGAPCIFPFTYAGKTYYNCTHDHSRIFQYFPWCSTKVDRNGKHYARKSRDGFYNVGICEDKETCPLPYKRKLNMNLFFIIKTLCRMSIFWFMFILIKGI